MAGAIQASSRRLTAEQRRQQLVAVALELFAQRGYRENAAGVPVPDMDPKIADAFKNPSAAADMWPLFSMIKGVPLLVIRGALSDLLSAATVARMAREKPELQQVEVANRGHTPLLDEPECLTAIDAFVDRHGREGQAAV